jgi:hypothetical protein
LKIVAGLLTRRFGRLEKWRTHFMNEKKGLKAETPA